MRPLHANPSVPVTQRVGRRFHSALAAVALKSRSRRRCGVVTVGRRLDAHKQPVNQLGEVLFEVFTHALGLNQRCNHFQQLHRDTSHITSAPGLADICTGTGPTSASLKLRATARRRYYASERRAQLCGTVSHATRDAINGPAPARTGTRNRSAHPPSRSRPPHAAVRYAHGIPCDMGMLPGRVGY